MSEVLLSDAEEEGTTEEYEDEAFNEIPASLLSYFEASRRRAAACEKLILEDLEYLTAAQCKENVAMVDKDTINETADTFDEQNEDNSASSGSHADEQEFSAVPYERQDAVVSELQLDMESRRQVELDFEEELQRMKEAEKLRQQEADMMALKAQEELEREFRLQQELLDDMKRRVEEEVKKSEEEQRSMAQRQKEEEEEEEKKRKRQDEERRKRVERKLKEEEDEKRKKAERKQIEAEDERGKKEDDDKRRKKTENELKEEMEMTRSKEEEDKKMKQIEEEDKKRVNMEKVEALRKQAEEEERMRRKEEEERHKQMQEEMMMDKEEDQRRNEAGGKRKEENEMMREQKEKKGKVEEEEVWRSKIGEVEKRKEEEWEVNQEEGEKRKKNAGVMQIEEVMRKNERSKKEVSSRLQEEEKRRTVDEEESRKKETNGKETEQEETREQESVKKEEEEKRRKGEEEEKMHKQMEDEVEKRVTVEAKKQPEQGEKKREGRRIKEEEESDKMEEAEEGMKKMAFTQNEEKKRKTEDEGARMKRDEAEIRSTEIAKRRMRGKEWEETRTKEREGKSSIAADRTWQEETRLEDDTTRTNVEEDRWRGGKEEPWTEEVEKRKKNDEGEKRSQLQRKWRESVDKDLRMLKELRKKESEVMNKTGQDEQVQEEEKREEQRLKQEDEKTIRRWEEEVRSNKQKRDKRTEKNEENEEPLRKNQNKRHARRISRTETGKNIHENVHENIEANIQQNISDNLQLNFHGNINQNIQENIHENIDKKNIPQNSHPYNPENFQQNIHENVHKNNHQNPSCQTCLSQLMGQKWLSWMKVRILWSEMQNGCRRQSSVGSRRKPRSSGQDGNLPPLCPGTLLRAAGRRSLQEVTILVLEDLPGCSLSTLAQCARLQSLTLRRCGLKVLEGISGLAELCYVDVQENNISRMDCENMSGLRVLKMSHNQMTSIHGLSGAENLDVLELSHNSITRVAGLGSLRRLQHLYLDHNQLVSTKGLRDVCTLLHLVCSHNHLAGVEDLESNVVLRRLDLTSNSLTEPPALHDHVLLGELHMDDNSLASLSRLLTASWLPHLHTLTLARNRLTQLPDMSVAISLTNLDLRFNCLSDVQNVCHSLEGCCSLDEVHLTGNPLQRESSWRCTLQAAVSSLRMIDGTVADVHLTDSAVARQIHSASDGLLSLIRTQRQQISHLQQQHIEQLSKSSRPLDGIQLCCGHLMEDLRLAEEQRHALECAHMGQTSARQATLEETPDEVSPIASGSGSATSLCDGSRSSVQMTSYHQDWDFKSTVAPEVGGGKAAADEESPESAVLRSNIAQHQAATVIQAQWRGFTLRRRLAAALAAVTSLQGDDDASEVVDMEEFILDEAMLEQGWTCEDAPARCSSESKPPLFWQLPGFYPEHSQWVLPPLPTRRLTQAWEVKERERVSPQSSNRKKSPSTSVASDFSERSERILEEWGFTNRHTAELMLRRAQKMKSQRKSTGPSRHLEAWRNPPLTTYQLEAPNRPARRSRSSTRVHQAEAGLGPARWDRTCEWLQNQNTLRHSESEHFLPDISADASSGGRRRRRQLAPESGRTQYHATGVWACNSLPAQAGRDNKNTLELAAESRIVDWPQQGGLERAHKVSLGTRCFSSSRKLKKKKDKVEDD
ncbi:uncharacterized protein lrriq1 isoform X3 [Vanacampus margaritifer]